MVSSCLFVNCLQRKFGQMISTNRAIAMPRWIRQTPWKIAMMREHAWAWELWIFHLMDSLHSILASFLFKIPKSRQLQVTRATCWRGSNESSAPRWVRSVSKSWRGLPIITCTENHSCSLRSSYRQPDWEGFLASVFVYPFEWRFERCSSLQKSLFSGRWEFELGW